MGGRGRLAATVAVAVAAAIAAAAIRRRPQRAAVPATPSRPLVVCLGDSITKGLQSSNYLRLLEARPALANHSFINAGVTGDLAWNAARRLDGVIASDPDAVVVLLGTNDVRAALGGRLSDFYYRVAKGITRPVTVEWYRENLALILDRLSSETRARVAVLEIPPVGEDVDSRATEMVAQRNGVIHAECDARGITCLPLHRRLVGLLPSGRRVPTPGLPGILRASLRSAIVRLRGGSWNDASDRLGLAITVDHIHLNDTAAAVIADLVEGFLVCHDMVDLDPPRTLTSSRTRRRP